MKTSQVRIVHGVPGPAGQLGVLLLMPPSEALDWDLRTEVASTALQWMADRQAWWVAAPYASTAIAIAARFSGGVTPLEEQAEPDDAGWRGAARHRWRALLRLLRSPLGTMKRIARGGF